MLYQVLGVGFFRKTYIVKRLLWIKSAFNYQYRVKWLTLQTLHLKWLTKFQVVILIFPQSGKRLYSLAFEITLDTKLREFQYKLLNLIIFTNKKLYHCLLQGRRGIPGAFTVLCKSSIFFLERSFILACR